MILIISLIIDAIIIGCLTIIVFLSMEHLKRLEKRIAKLESGSYAEAARDYIKRMNTN